MWTSDEVEISNVSMSLYDQIDSIFTKHSKHSNEQVSERENKNPHIIWAQSFPQCSLR